MAIDAYIFRARVRLAKGNVGGRARGLGQTARVTRGPRAILRWPSRLSRRGRRSCYEAGAARRSRRPPSTSSSHAGGKAQRLQPAPGSQRSRTSSKGSDEARSSPRQARECACGRGGSAPPKSLAGGDAGRAAELYDRIGRPADAATTRTARRGAAGRRGPARRGRERSSGSRSTSSAPRAPNATSARPRLCSRSASRRPGRDRRLRAAGSPRDPAARRTR